MCGGTAPLLSEIEESAGLSPRVRGNLAYPPPPLPRLGSIPACAGEPGAVSHKASSHAVYPRVCGGTAYNSAYRAAVSGLSPRVRGNRGRSRARGAVAG